MKEATGELNSTLIVVIAIAALAALFFTILWPMIKGNLKDEANCRKAFCDKGVIKGQNGVMCKWTNSDGNQKTIICPYKG